MGVTQESTEETDGKYGNTGTNKACLDAKYSHNKSMMNETLPNFWPKEQIGLPIELIMSLNAEARMLYDKIYDYCTYAADPQYQTLHRFRNQINRLADAGDREILIGYFNQDPAIRWNGMPCEPFEYYAEPY